MTTLDKQKLVEAVLYILARTKSLDYYRIFKILYFANAYKLAGCGSKLVADKFCALPDGPVPSMLYDCMKGNPLCDPQLKVLLDEAVASGCDDASYIYTSRREPDLDFLAKADIQALDRSIDENSSLSFRDLRDKSHGREWQRASKSKGMREMSSYGIALDAHASEDVAEYIRDMEQLESALR